MRLRGRRRLLSLSVAVLGLATLAPIAVAASADAATTRAVAARAATPARLMTLHGATSVTTAPGIAGALIGAGVVPLPVPGTTLRIGFHDGLRATYGFPVTRGNPDLSGPSGDILHSGGIAFTSTTAHLEIGRFDIDLAAGRIYARQVNFAPARIPVLDVDLSHAAVTTSHGRTVVSNIRLRLDPVAAGALNATFGLALPTDGSLVFGTARVTLR